MRKILTIFLFISLVSCSEYKENSALEKCASEGFVEYFPYYEELYANDEEYKAVEYQRLRKLEKSKLINGSSISIDPKVLGYNTMAYIGIFLDRATNNKTVVTELSKIKEVIECHYTTGDWSILTKILCKDNQDLMEILTKKIQVIKGVARTETYISLEQQINRQIFI